MELMKVSKLKENPAKAIYYASEYPLAIQSRSSTKAYLVGTELFEKIVSYIEDYIDAETVRKTDFSKGRDFEDMAKELDI